MTEPKSTLEPAFKALQRIRAEVKQRIGREGGHLNNSILNDLGAIEATLLQIEPLGSMLNTLNQQAQVMSHAYRSLVERVNMMSSPISNGPALPEGKGSGEPPETKGA